MDTMTVQDPPLDETPQRRASRSTSADDGAEIVVVVGICDDPQIAALSINAALATVQIGVCLTRDQLVAHRDACNAVLTATEPGA